MNKNKSIAVVIGTVVLTILLAFTTIVGFGPTGTGAARNIITGLDLSGGVSITYRAISDGTPSSEDMKDTIYKLQQRVAGYSTEAQVYQEGDDRINIEIPGVSDANKILEELGKPGSLSFQTEDGTTVLEGTDVQTAQAATSARQPWQFTERSRTSVNRRRSKEVRRCYRREHRQTYLYYL